MKASEFRGMSNIIQILNQANKDFNNKVDKEEIVEIVSAYNKARSKPKEEALTIAEIIDYIISLHDKNLSLRLMISFFDRHTRTYR